MGATSSERADCFVARALVCEQSLQRRGISAASSIGKTYHVFYIVSAAGWGVANLLEAMSATAAPVHSPMPKGLARGVSAWSYMCSRPRN